MKKQFIKAVLFVGIYSIISNGFAQDTNQQWNVAIYDESFSPEHTQPTWNTYLLKSQGDTLINNFEYKKLYKSYDSLFIDYTYFGGVRIDSKRILINIIGNPHNDFLLYDYNLKVGDTTTIYRAISSDFHRNLVTLDSLKERVLNKINVKEYYVTYSMYGQSEQDIWIEDIGSVKHGFLNESCFSTTGCYTTSYLLCFSENNELIFQDTSFNVCFKKSITNDIGIELKNNYKIYPTLLTSHENVVVESTKLKNQIKIFSLQGTLVYYKEFSKLQCDLDLKNLKNGFYIILVNGKTFKLLIRR